MNNEEQYQLGRESKNLADQSCFVFEKVEGIERTDGLQEWVIKIDLNKNVTETEKRFLEKYQKLSFHAWGKVDESKGETVDSVFRHAGIVLAAGLASNYLQWDCEDSFVSKLGKKLGTDKSWVAVAIDLPGFGGSRLKSGQETEQNVSAEEFTELLRFGLNKFNVVRKENVSLVGHSSGGEAVIPFSAEGYKVFACNPALKAKRGLIFDGISLGNIVGSKTREVLPTITAFILNGLTRSLAGATGGIAAQMTAAEQHTNWISFVAKSSELSRIDEKFPTAPSVIPSVLITSGDRLTPAWESEPWLSKWLADTASNLRLADILIPLSADLSKRAAHNGLFILPELMDVLVKHVGEHALANAFVAVEDEIVTDERPVSDAIGVPGPQVTWEEVGPQGASGSAKQVEPELAGGDSVGGPGPGQRPEIRVTQEKEERDFQREFIRLNQQAYTMETFVYMSRELGKYLKPGDAKIVVPTDFPRHVLERVFAHPHILERENIQPDQVQAFINQDPFNFFMLMEKYYFASSSQAADDTKKIIVANSFLPDFIELSKKRQFTHIPSKTENPFGDLYSHVQGWFFRIRSDVISPILISSITNARTNKATIEIQTNEFMFNYAAALPELEECQQVVFDVLARRITEFAEKRNQQVLTLPPKE